MNLYQKNLYNELMTLCSERELFFFKDHVKDLHTYRVFSYRMGSYTDFCQPSALECRGVLFRMNEDLTDAEALVSLPQPKIFNLHENPSVMNVDFSTVAWFEEKSDGSLISSYIHDDKLHLKSKTSLTSHQAVDAMNWLYDHDRIKLHFAIDYYANIGITTIMEWCDPDPKSRIVLFYDKPQLRIFSMRDTRTGEILNYRTSDLSYLKEKRLVGEYVDRDLEYLDTITQYSVERIYTTDAEKFANNVPEESGIEGYIMVHDNDFRIKIKTQWYVTQHKLKDSVTNEKALFACAVVGSTDDLKSIFYDNEGAMKAITDMEEFVEPLYAQFVYNTEQYVSANKDLDRKSFAIKAQQELSKQEFHCAMALYVGKEVDYNNVLIKNTDLYLAEYKGSIVAEMEE